MIICHNTHDADCNPITVTWARLGLTWAYYMVLSLRGRIRRAPRLSVRRWFNALCPKLNNAKHETDEQSAQTNVPYSDGQLNKIF